MSETLMLLDGASLWFRAFYGVPEKITAPDGRPVNAVRGFTDMVAALIHRVEPARLAVCLDLDWRPQFRTDAIASYKAHRVAESGREEIAPESLGPQVDMIMEVLNACGLATAGAQGYEADDVLGTICAQEQTDSVVVVSGDRDLLQVVTDSPVSVRVLYVGSGLAKATLYGPTEVAEKYGVPAHRAGQGYAELALLRGDPSDGLPGVPGIGEKTASKLLMHYQSLEGLHAAVQDKNSGLATGLRTKLTESADYLIRGLPVVQVVRNAEVTLSRSDRLSEAVCNQEKLDQLAQELGIGSALNRLKKAMGSLSE